MPPQYVEETDIRASSPGSPHVAAQDIPADPVANPAYKEPMVDSVRAQKDEV